MISERSTEDMHPTSTLRYTQQFLLNFINIK
jgi:hypothetical protein